MCENPGGQGGWRLTSGGRGAAQGWRGASETVSWRWGLVLGTKARSDTVCFTLSEQVCNSKNCGGQEKRWVNTKDTIPVIFVSQRGEGEKRVALNW